MTFNCDGAVTAWRYYSRRFGMTVYFGVWNPVSDHEFQLMGFNKIVTTRVGLEEYAVKDYETIIVKKGYVVGIHYDSSKLPEEFMVIPHASEVDPTPWTREQLFDGYAKDIDHSHILGQNGYVDMTGPLYKKWRIPSLQAIVQATYVHCGPPPLVTNADISGQDVIQGSRYTYTCKPGYAIDAPAEASSLGSNYTENAATITCQPDGFWSPIPRCLPIVKCNWYQLPKRQYTKTSSNLEIYASRPILCSGLVKYWRFDSRQPAGHRIYFDIWRRLANNQYALVGFNSFVTTSIGINEYHVDSESQILALVGDIVGVHYDAAGPAVIPYGDQSDEIDTNLLVDTISEPMYHSSIRVGEPVSLPNIRPKLKSPALEAYIYNEQEKVYSPCNENTVCPVNSDCVQRNCFSPACVCNEGFWPNEKRTKCLATSQLNQRCDETVSCGAFSSYCTAQGVCGCVAQWEPASDGRRCKPTATGPNRRYALLGERCAVTDECYFGWYDQECAGGVCRCRDGFRVALPEERRAFPDLGFECRPVGYNLSKFDISPSFQFVNADNCFP